MFLLFQLVGSAPQFPHGIIDNIVELGKVRKISVLFVHLETIR